MNAAEQGPPALPGEVWRISLDGCTFAIEPDGEAHVWWHGHARVEWDKPVPVTAAETKRVHIAWAIAERARAEKAEAIADRCGLLASQDRDAREKAEEIVAAWGQFWLTREEHESLAAAWESARTDGAAASIAPRRDAAKVAREEAEARLRALGVEL